ncbi:hypothetical protein T552_02408 [Pneumocystis carinii B80]|uniref:Protein YIF1 n=1 Tax=Pneumocystis carinii (strain B80) TaxID=1408658 RepID=A0A0W4ZGD6_PNEC8|nr:hypothetical protein T552_02408 [Pneumocystis carinii B80]KTW27430.1 hypothetical protein T552_02408 [Pneumocystis carinii B80]
MYGHQEDKDRKPFLMYAPQPDYSSTSRSSPVLGKQSPQTQNPYTSYLGVNNAAAQMGLQVGRSAVMAGQEYVERNMGRFISMIMLRYYFNVSNYYVISKISVVLFPWRHKCWSRLTRHSEMNEAVVQGFRSPREDINSPDMYIPVMAFVTYVLLSSLLAGFKGDFHPELLGTTALMALIVVTFEIFAIKFGCYILSIYNQTQFLDLVAYSGYKFIGIIVTMLSSIFHNLILTYLVFFYTFISTAFFLLRSLRYIVLPESNISLNATMSLSQRRKRIYFLFGISMAQILFMFILM